MRRQRSVQFSFVLSLVLALLLQLIALPDWLGVVRPYWLPMILSYWALCEPRVSSLVGGFIVGLAADVVFGTVLGQHALALVVVAYLVSRLRGVFVLFELWQATLVLVPIWALYTFLLFWIDGLTGHQASAQLRWMPIIPTTLLWPLVYGLMVRWLRPRRDD
ncbi:rod shape-determining protein MreD [Flagellatimonas centrodinii]|uniref:rod shape-determining protein MreD n=1 Tax=Flagellatimonas centrodinii TaxID=2806210 RepID=UPI001FED3F60|nr:rod shape-determining protein MreD [Flagellatimonas centrodinii]ULQ45493.1 rod shape-determining protein MreD [Flagellatimonas centrodinii]